jgi:hypothetical protein
MPRVYDTGAEEFSFCSARSRIYRAFREMIIA